MVKVKKNLLLIKINLVVFTAERRNISKKIVKVTFRVYIMEVKPVHQIQI